MKSLYIVTVALFSLALLGTGCTTETTITPSISPDTADHGTHTTSPAVTEPTPEPTSNSTMRRFEGPGGFTAAVEPYWSVTIDTDHVRIQNYPIQDDSVPYPANAFYMEILQGFQTEEDFRRAYDHCETSTFHGQEATHCTGRNVGGQMWPGEGYYVWTLKGLSFEVYSERPGNEGAKLAKGVLDSVKWTERTNN